MPDPTLLLAVHVPADLSDLVTAWLFEAGVGGVEEREVDDDGNVALVVYSSDPAELDAVATHVATEQALLATRGVAAAAFRFERGTVTVDWEAEWLAHVRAVPLGDGFVAQPLGDPAPLPRGRQAIRFRPAWAFGDGSHPTTQLAATALERAVRGRPGASVLDVGTGSGVLALLALLAGAGRVVGIDVDPKAVAAARENATLNPGGDRLDLSATPLAAVADAFDVVVANITESTLCDLAPELARVTAERGVLLLTGVIAGDTARLEARLGALGLRRIATSEQAEWLLLELGRG